MACVLIRRGERRTETEEGEAETGVMGPQVKDAWSPQKLEEAGRTLPWSLQRGRGSATPESQASGLQN